MPQLRDGNVFAYLTHHCQWSRERLDAFQKDDGYLMYLDRHVEDMKVGSIAQHIHHVYIEGQVTPEERQGSEIYNTRLLVHTQTCQIHSAGCQCVAA
jgi:hypothetical protein